MGYEKWEKLGDGKDEQREQEMGPVLAEGEFTIIDLLQTMGLYEPAEFYQNRGIYRILKGANPSRKGAYGFGQVVPPPVASFPKGNSQCLQLPPLDEDESLEIVGEGNVEDFPGFEDIDAGITEMVKMLSQDLDF